MNWSSPQGPNRFVLHELLATSHRLLLNFALRTTNYALVRLRTTNCLCLPPFPNYEPRTTNYALFVPTNPMNPMNCFPLWSMDCPTPHFDSTRVS